MENYFNYYTEIEEYFWRKRGTSLYVTTLDWALIDSWKEAQIPLEAVLKGIDRAFEKQESRRDKVRRVNSLAYCQQAVLEAARDQQRASLPDSAAEPFSREELAKYFSRNATLLEKAARRFDEQGRPESASTFRAIAASLGELQAAASSDAPLNLEESERRLTVLEEKMFSTLQAVTDEETLVAIRAEMDRSLAPVRSQMSAEQIIPLQKQFLQRKLLEKSALPRLSLFYL